VKALGGRITTWDSGILLARWWISVKVTYDVPEVTEALAESD
jgi:hypothetical protein